MESHAFDVLDERFWIVQAERTVTMATLTWIKPGPQRVGMLR